MTVPLETVELIDPLYKLQRLLASRALPAPDTKPAPSLPPDHERHRAQGAPAAPPEQQDAPEPR